MQAFHSTAARRSASSTAAVVDAVDQATGEPAPGVDDVDGVPVGHHLQLLQRQHAIVADRADGEVGFAGLQKAERTGRDDRPQHQAEAEALPQKGAP